MTPPDLQALCERAQQLLVRMEYLAAEKALIEAERIALQQADFATLARLYMPLQEVRRQRRQRCGEGIVRLDLIASGPDTNLDAEKIIDQYPHGQLLIAGWGSIAPAREARRIQEIRGLYVEIFLGATFAVGAGRVVVIAPLDDVSLPDAHANRSIDELIKLLPAHCVVLDQAELPRGDRPGDWKTYAEVMAMWERLHAPFLSAADQTPEPRARIEAYRKTIRVDYACEFAHQRLSKVAQSYARETRLGPH
jgi:hypothetical protein